MPLKFNIFTGKFDYVNDGNVVAPASSTDNAITRWDGTTGRLLQNSTATLSDGGLFSWPSAGEAITGSVYQIGRNADATNRLQYNVPAGVLHEFSLNDVAKAAIGNSGILTNAVFNLNSGANAIAYFDITGTTISRNVADANHALIINLTNASSTGSITSFRKASSEVLSVNGTGALTWTGTSAITAGAYQIARNADATNRLQLNVPTGAVIETSVNGVETATIGTSGLILSVPLQSKQGTDIASGTTIVIPADGNVFELTGTTAVTLITKTGYQDGTEITLIANESVTITNGTATSGDDTTILLAGAGNFAMTANDVLKLVLSTTTAGGQAWREVCRTII